MKNKFSTHFWNRIRSCITFAFGQLETSMPDAIEIRGQVQHSLVNSYS